MDRAELVEDVQQALAGAEPAVRRLVAALTPVIQARVARCLLLRRSGPSAGRDVRQEVEDLTQDTFLVLFADGGKVLRSWQPERGLTLLNFVGLVAERRVASILRSSRRSPWQEDPTLAEDLDRIERQESGPEEIAASREQLGLLMRRLTEELSPLGRHLFDLLFVRELALPEVVAQTGLSADAVYAWRSRLRKLARRLLAEESENPPGRRMTSKGGE
jgi:RNA polymerase sigma factor (sigma-70 family)